VKESIKKWRNLYLVIYEFITFRFISFCGIEFAHFFKDKFSINKFIRCSTIFIKSPFTCILHRKSRSKIISFSRILPSHHRINQESIWCISYNRFESIHCIKFCKSSCFPCGRKLNKNIFAILLHIIEKVNY
jgi:hypothetical protein